VLAAATGLALVTTAGHDALPVIMRGDEDMPAKYTVAWATWLVTVAALSVLNLWLTVVVCAWACDIALSAVFNAGRFSLGWYAGRVYGLFSSSILLLVLAFENTRLYRRLADSYAGERVQRRLVEDRTAQLSELNRSLEQRISARTAQLESSNRELEAEAVERRRAEAELRRSKEEVRQLAALSAAAREQERARVARELHDELDQALYALKLKVDWLEQHCPAGDEPALSAMASMRQLMPVASAIGAAAPDDRNHPSDDNPACMERDMDSARGGCLTRESGAPRSLPPQALPAEPDTTPRSPPAAEATPPTEGPDAVAGRP
jgi:hypothetical protein